MLTKTRESVDKLHTHTHTHKAIYERGQDYLVLQILAHLKGGAVYNTVPSKEGVCYAT